jgi:hypothetical protein
MGILDALRGRKSRNDDGDDDKTEIGPGDPAAPEPTVFRPRTDGIYLTIPDSGAAQGSGSAVAGHALQFTGARVREVSGVTDQQAAAAALAGPDVRTGDYTPTGRFSVGAPFEMLVTFAVTEIGDDHFTARRTDAADRSTAELRYAFRPTGGQPGDLASGA